MPTNPTAPASATAAPVAMPVPAITAIRVHRASSPCAIAATSPSESSDRLARWLIRSAQPIRMSGAVVATSPSERLATDPRVQLMRSDSEKGLGAKFRISAITAPHRLDRPTPIGKTRSEEHTYELQSLMRISYAVFCLKKKTQQ